MPTDYTSDDLDIFIDKDFQDADRLDGVLSNIFTAKSKMKMRFRDEGDILLDNDTRVKVVSECNYDPETDETSYTLVDIYTGDKTSGKRHRDYRCVKLGDVRYSHYDRVIEFDHYQKVLFTNIAKYVCCHILLSATLSHHDVQSLSLKVADNLFYAVSKYPFKEDIPDYNDLLKIVTEAFLQICTREFLFHVQRIEGASG